MEFGETDLSKATNNFSIQERIGEGGFGCVYKGYMYGTTVAVKIMKEVHAIEVCYQKQCILNLIGKHCKNSASRR